MQKCSEARIYESLRITTFLDNSLYLVMVLTHMRSVLTRHYQIYKQ